MSNDTAVAAGSASGQATGFASGQSDHAIDREGLETAVATLKFLANPKLLPILCRLGQEEVSAGELAEFVDMSPSALSQHLRRLKDQGLVATRRDHRMIYYRLTDDKIRRLITVLQELYCSGD